MVRLQEIHFLSDNKHDGRRNATSVHPPQGTKDGTLWHRYGEKPLSLILLQPRKFHTINITKLPISFAIRKIVMPSHD